MLDNSCSSASIPDSFYRLGGAAILFGGRLVRRDLTIGGDADAMTPMPRVMFAAYNGRGTLLPNLLL
jgi:hypothetical protein